MSLRARVLIGLTAVAVVLVLAAVLVGRTTERYLVGQVDDQLDRAARIEGRAPRPGGGEDETRNPGPGAAGPDSPSTLFVAVVTGDEVRTVRRPTLASDAAEGPVLTVDQVTELRGQGVVGLTDDATGDTYRATVPASGRFTVIYALPLDDVEQAVRRLQFLGLAAVGAVMAVLGLVAFWVLRLGVRPVKEMTSTAAAIGGGDLSRRIPPSPPGTEAGDLGLALNAMLERLEGAFEDRRRSEDRLRRFVADASHELRTPVTTIRGYAELYRAGGLTDEQALGEAMRRTESEAVRMGSLVDDLLHLARLDQGRPLRFEQIDLGAVAHDAAMDARAVEPARRITVDAPAGVIVPADDALVRQVVANLVTNARIHTPTTAEITLRVRSDEARAVLEVSDDGPGMGADVASRAFERFYRADAGRARATGGSGLGLAIVASVIEAHGGLAEIVTAPGAGTTVRVTLPTER